MAALVTKAQVAAIANIDLTANSDVIELAIAAADLIIVEDLSSASLSSARKTQIELYLAAHFSATSITYGPLAANSLGEATERYHNVYSAGLRSTLFGQQAIALDTSNTLTKYADRVEHPDKKKALFTVVGTQPTNYYDDLE